MRLLAVFLACLALAPAAALGQDAAPASVDERISAAISPITDAIAGVIFYSVPIAGTDFPLIVGWLIVAATVFTLYFGFVQLRRFGHAIRLVKGDFANPNDAGEVSHFQALATALSGTVGLGNIAGVAVAISLGGPGATFWMILAGMLGMASKFTECTLGVKYRNEHPDGSVSGGPMYYLSKGLAEKGMPGFGRLMAFLFSIFCVLASVGAGNMFQANQALQQVVSITGGADSIFAANGWLFGLIVALILGFVIIGGIKSIARVTDKIVPFMAVLYVLASLIIILGHIGQVGDAFASIFAGAFTGEGVAGGVIGALIQGFRRAAFSNEAGIGSASIAHSAVRTKEPITEGYVALLEPFIDTVVICTMTALVIIITDNAFNTEASGVALTSAAYASVFSWFPYVLSVAVVLFAFSTMLSWSYYGLKAWTYLTGESVAMEVVFKLLFCLCVILGSTMSLDAVIDFSDAMLFAMAIPNVIGLYILMPVVREEMGSYQGKLDRGEIVAVA
ncbi:alanine/glycine:cation symporter family protein [Marinivivus vitaminiproducens]|uniref:alanine/glycine:cation symporter family protein n=1 Tax=Marinivivus vitaminiproducens TaxID=3035935 RepID=UPI0027A6E5CC|nr:alanine/glycine:cation symporter family protein [Geminicoccaceae bacterium SCSIO 64248]